MNSFIYTGDELVMVIDSTPYTVDRSHPRFEDILTAVKEKRWENIPALVSVAKAIDQFGDGRVVVNEDEGVILYNGHILHNSLTERIMWMLRDGFDINPFILFVENLMKNPSKRAVDELYKFMEYGKLPITEDGCFLAYKRVRADYMDVHSGTCLNKPASLMPENGHGLLYTTANGVTVTVENGNTTLSMARNAVQDDSQITCSYGLHFCSLEYLGNFSGERVVIMKINPADVVSIPADYNNTKGRCCKYQVVGEYKGSMTDPAFTKSVVNSDGSDYEPGEEDEEDDYIDTTRYDDGYDAGENDCRSGGAMMYSEEDLADAERHQDEILPYIRGYFDGYNTMSSTLADMSSEEHKYSGPIDYQATADYIEGYVKGHKEGRAKELPEVSQEDLDLDVRRSMDDYSQGYVAGYKDGKGHKARRYTLD